VVYNFGQVQVGELRLGQMVDIDRYGRWAATI